MKDLVGRLKNVLLYIVLCIILLQAAFLQLIEAKDPSFQIIALKKDSNRTFELVPQMRYLDSLDYDHLATPLAPTSDSQLYMSWVISEDTASLDALMQHLSALRKYSSGVNLSLMPAEPLSDTDYIASVSEIKRAIQNNNLNHVHLIVYPTNKKTLALFHKEEIGGIGVVLEQSEDLKWLDVVYKAQKGKGTLVVTDHIKSFYSGDIPKGVKTVYEVYYTLALRYPKIETVLTPYARALPVTQYTSVYATISDEVKKIPTLLNRDSKLSGEQQLILWSDHQFFADTAYVHYKWNDDALIEKAHFPYPVSLDTTSLHNGVNRLKMIGYDKHGSVLWRKALDVQVANAFSLQRAPRREALYPQDARPTYAGPYIPVLMYHSFSNALVSESENSYVEIELFEKQLQALLENNYTPISFYDLHEYDAGRSGLPAKPIIITADDGYLDNYTLAYPVLKKYNAAATFFISTAYVGVKTANDHFAWEDAAEMEGSGLIDIQIHGYDHTPFTDLSRGDVEYQVSMSRGLIEKHLGSRDVVVVSYPQFRHTRSTQALLTQMGVDFQITNLATNPSSRGTVLQRLGSAWKTAWGTVLQSASSTPDAEGTVLQSTGSTPDAGGTVLQSAGSTQDVGGTVLQSAGSTQDVGGTVLQRDNIQRVNVPNTMSPEELIRTLESLTD